MSTSQSPDKRISWLIAATLLNSALSLGALGLWYFAPNRTAVPAPPGPSLATRPVLPLQDRPPFPQRTFVPFEPPEPLGTAPEGPRERLPSDRLPNRSLLRNSGAKASPSTMALAERLHLLPEGLVQTFGDESGEIPRDVAQRLEKAFDAATNLAKQRNLNESQTQSVTTLLTHYAFRVLQEEKAAAPGPVDPVQIERLREEALDAIEMTCGAEVRKAAEKLVDGG